MYIEGSVTGHYEFFDLLREYLTGRPTQGTPAYTGTGDGTLDDFEVYPKCPTETWTLTCTTGGGDGVGIFSVTGSVTGAKAAATVGTPYDNDFIAFTLTDGAIDFVDTSGGDEFIIALTEGAMTEAGQAYHELEYGTEQTSTDGVSLDHFVHLKAPGLTVIPVADSGNTGDGTLDGITRYSYTSLTAESWVVTATSATNFTVTGSISGSVAAATVGTIYDNGVIRFLITAGGTAFVSGDEFTIGKPNEIFINIGTYQHTGSGDYYNLEIAGATGYLSGQDGDFDAQPGTSDGKGIPLYQSTITYLIVANGQRLVFSAQVETTIAVAYAGFYYPNGTPLQMPYPMAIGGMLPDNALTRYSDTDNIFPFKSEENLFVRKPSGAWDDAQVWPYNSDFVDGDFYSIRDTGGTYPLLPIIPLEGTAGEFDQYGELDGVKFVPGFAMFVNDTVTEGGDTYLVISNWGRTDFDDYCAIKKD